MTRSAPSPLGPFTRILGLGPACKLADVYPVFSRSILLESAMYDMLQDVSRVTEQDTQAEYRRLVAEPQPSDAPHRHWAAGILAACPAGSLGNFAIF